MCLRKEVRFPVSHLFAMLGVFGLAALVFLVNRACLGLDLGGMERLVFYSSMFWVPSLGTYMFAEEKAPSQI